MKMKKIIVRTKSQKYPVFIGSNLVSKFSKIMLSCSTKPDKCLLLVDRKIPKKMLKNIKTSLSKKKIFIFNFKANERNKNQKTIDDILKILLQKNFSRNDCLISIGGGITGDLGGFAASLFKRGLQFINVPTTLLSQVDSSIGGKTGINTSYGKNLIGSFYQPKFVISDSNFLKSLPRREVVCGYGEILKHSLISNKTFFNFLDKNLKEILNLKTPFIEKAIYESCKVKKNIVEKDEKEINLRKILNFGHTFAHAFEASLGYSRKLNHGEAVLLGIKCATKLSLNYKFLNFHTYLSIKKHFEKIKLPSSLDGYFSIKNANKILSFMIKDKKNKSDKITLILLKNIGYPVINSKIEKKRIINFLKKELDN